MSEANNADKPAGDKDAGNEHLNLRVQSQEGTTIHFKIKKSTPLKKLMSAYCTRMGMKNVGVRFIYEGDTIEDTDTPLSLNMTDEDTIEVFQVQTGGY